MICTMTVEQNEIVCRSYSRINYKMFFVLLYIIENNSSVNIIFKYRFMSSLYDDLLSIA